jgi:hypothetical protein
MDVMRRRCRFGVIARSHIKSGFPLESPFRAAFGVSGPSSSDGETVMRVNTA